MTNEVMIPVPEIQPEVVVSETAKAEMTKLQGAAKLITRVHNAFMQTRATEAAVKIRTFLKRVEESRKAAKAPVLAKQGAIDDAAASLALPLKADVDRLDTLLTGFVIAERKRHAEEEAAARETARKAQLAADQEAQRIRDAATAAAAAAPNPVVAQQALDLGAAQAKQVQAAAMAPVVVMPPPRPSGMRVTPSHWTYEVEDLKVLAKHEDGKYVRIEENKAALNAAITLGVRSIPGVRIFEETKVNTSASRR